MLPRVKPRWIICEDGVEYFDRFLRFVGEELELVRAADAHALLAALVAPAVGVVLDLDFRRTPAEWLIDEYGRPPGSEEERRRLAASQGALIVQLLRARGLGVPVLLCADIDDAAQAAYLVEALAPLEIVPSAESLLDTVARLRRLSATEN